MVDARDLKSLSHKEYGFESHRPHHHLAESALLRLCRGQQVGQHSANFGCLGAGNQKYRTGSHGKGRGRTVETRTEQRLLVAFTAALALATFGLVADSHWSSEKQLRAYVYLNPREAFHIDGQGMLQVYSIVGNSGLTPASNVQRFAGIEVLPPTDIPTQRTVREVGSTVIGPRSEIALIKNWAHGQVSADQAQQIRKGDLRV
jgi:hypothetical protein